MADEVLIRLFPSEKARGIRDGVRGMAQWRLNEVAEDWGVVAPIEGAGVVYPYFQLTKLADSATKIDETTWEPLRRHPGYDKSGIDLRTSPQAEPTAEWPNALMEWANNVHAGGRRGSDFDSIDATIGALPVDRVPEYLTEQIPALLEAFPSGSLWFLQTDQLLPKRLSLQRILLNQELIPDFFERDLTTGLPQLSLLQEHSLTNASSFSKLFDLALLSFPPTTLGFAFDWMPNALVFSMGFAVALTEDHPPTFASIFAPHVQSGYGFHWRDTQVWDEIRTGHIETFLQWWVTRLNTLYSHATDPTRFSDETGHYQPQRQVAWLFTLERMFADTLVIRSHPQSSGLVLQQSAFDLLDKAEVLLGYDQSRTGTGFQRLLNASEMVPRLERIWDTRLPIQLRERFKAYTSLLYERLYAETREHAYEHRVEDDGILVWSDPEGRLIERTWDDYVPKLIRAIRNSTHGLVEQLESPHKHKERNIIATHRGKLPGVLPDLAALLSLALMTDAERLCEGTWLE